jgi:hypothetical protein
MKTKYKVTGLTGYSGHQPGEEFEAELDPEQERRAVERGSIEVVKQTKTKKEEEPDA